MKPTLFITGTDTDSGKTLVGTGLLHLARREGFETQGYKPLASGCLPTQDGLRNSDALALMAESNLGLEYAEVNPFTFAPAIAPHIAANQQGQDISITNLTESMMSVGCSSHMAQLVEGAGGWRLPLQQGEYLSTFVAQQQWQVVLVVGMKLGCLNHAILTAEAIAADGLTLVGWVANHIDGDMSCFEENLASLQQMMPAPCLGVVPPLVDTSAEQVANHLQLPHCWLNAEQDVTVSRVSRLQA
ncbi:dethiobiotin synthase [Shewanella sp. NIFS-20-20]|uniref:dethiobiotin synthase n=1 Tax=Shewanella sp. NIFS-20-20 TaxID=2853806 RepID=UPI001C49067C|nr:dethiobiotin synthase [Shewanella sp. NIFS-20-20]MBV7317206.1 dethiobiotin synthase [Shewanella sp. NIFS-20-20]